MKITAPELNIESLSIDEANSVSKRADPTFEDEISDILKLATIPPKFLVNRSNTETPESKLQVLHNFTSLCQEEVIPRHLKAAEAIGTKSESLQCKLRWQQKELVRLTNTSQALKASSEQLNMVLKLTLAKHHDLQERLKDTLKTLQDSCKNRTMAERKMAEDLVVLECKTEKLKGHFKDTSSKMNYYNAQVKAQSDLVKKRTQPLHLDKSRTHFMKTNLRTMGQNIADLVKHTKVLLRDMADLAELENLEGISKI